MLFNGQAFYIINKKSGTAMDLDAVSQKSIIGWEHHGGDNQRWMIVPNLESLDDSCWIENVAFKKYLSVEGNLCDNAKLVGTSTKFLWNIRRDEHDFNGWRFFVRGTERNADLANHSDRLSGTVTLWYHTEAESQVWYLREVHPTNPSNTL
ncbi:hypothetical protein BDM02DRAFT_3115279 [Thelephora ganbajun]|uniref:Uncharacterized protein n=1 Tax=Thelephora ganbajun TaxID=370292 RepID=A0ACB6ZGF1_THEGA|nr:hypothetical protein BDM02DRAFT_3115279 [Thelephora ganbajun]